MDAPPIQYATSSDGTSIAFVTWGVGPAFAYVPMLVPVQAALSTRLRLPEGMTGPWETRLTAAMSESHQVLMYDPRGTGDSSRGITRASLDDHMGDFDAVLREAGMDGQLAVASHVYGTPLAVRFAAEHQERLTRLVLRDAYASHDVVSSTVPFSDLAKGDWDSFLSVLASLTGGTYAISAAFIADRLRGAIAQDDFLVLRDGARTFDVRRSAADVSCPALVITDPDHWSRTGQSARWLSATIPDAQMIDSRSALASVRRTSELLDRAVSFLTSEKSGTNVAGGFQTILFTDLESSTALTQRVGDEAAQEVLRGHNTAVRGALEEHGGREVKHTGDGIMASFPSAVAAVQAGIAIQRELMDGEVRVRIGINAGEPIAEDDDLFGTAVQLAARIVDRAEPGQVLVSNVVRELCAGKTFEFTSIGEATLKGFDEPVTLYEVTAS